MLRRSPIADFSRKAIMTIILSIKFFQMIQPSHSGLQPKGDYDLTDLLFKVSGQDLSHSGLQPKGDYDIFSTGRLNPLKVPGPIADFSRKAIMTTSTASGRPAVESVP